MRTGAVPEINAVGRACLGARQAPRLADMGRAAARRRPAGRDLCGCVTAKATSPGRSASTKQTTALLARWLDRRRKLSPGARAPVFCTLQGGGIDSSYVRRLLPRLAARAGIDRRVHAHGLRHTYAAELAREGTAINVIRDALGHTSLAVTDRYLRDVAPMHVIDTIRVRSWEVV